MDDVPLLCALLLDVLSTDAQGLSLGHPHVARVVEATSVAAAATMRPKKKKNTKKKKKKKPPTWGDQYKDPGRPGSLGGLHRFARTHRQTEQHLRPNLEKNWLIPYTNRSTVGFRPCGCKCGGLIINGWLIWW